MDNDDHNIRASGSYATYDAREYFSYSLDARVRLFSDDDPLPEGFQLSRYDWVRGEKWVAADEIQRFAKVETTCVWRGHRFQVGIIIGGSANVRYLDKKFDDVSSLPGMRRPDKYEVRGKVPVSELTEVDVHIEEVSLGDRSTNQTQRRSE